MASSGRLQHYVPIKIITSRSGRTSDKEALSVKGRRSGRPRALGILGARCRLIDGGLYCDTALRNARV